MNALSRTSQGRARNIKAVDEFSRRPTTRAYQLVLPWIRFLKRHLNVLPESDTALGRKRIRRVVESIAKTSCPTLFRQGNKATAGRLQTGIPKEAIVRFRGTGTVPRWDLQIKAVSLAGPTLPTIGSAVNSRRQTCTGRDRGVLGYTRTRH
eukprot:scaffold41224_cov229-Amphora_coffeaeformis.AAC.2